MTHSSDIPSNQPRASTVGAFGECRDCARRHQLPVGDAHEIALVVLREFEAIRRLDYRVPESQADPRLSFDNLFPPGQGNMFGVLTCEGRDGESVILRAFSSLREGIREIDGWVLPVLSADIYAKMILPAQREIKSLTLDMHEMGVDSPAFETAKAARTRVSQKLWEQMCAAYRFRNFRGEERSLAQALLPGTPVSGGMGECCAPKLLTHAALNGLRPTGLAEFYWGEDRKQGGRVSGDFYPSCEARCQPIMGFLLCGLDE
jgi:hypothetical protein